MGARHSKSPVRVEPNTTDKTIRAHGKSSTHRTSCSESIETTPTFSEVIEVESLEHECESAREAVATDEVSRIIRGSRNGRVLRKQTVLKADHYPSSHNSELDELIDGAPNFRQPTDLMPVFGTAAPTQSGLRAICQRVASSGQPIHWFNLRQEPCVYVRQLQHTSLNWVLA